MSLLEQASLIVTPNGFKASKLYSVIPSDGSGDLDVVRATTATRVNEDGIIETVVANVPRLNYTNGVGSILVEPQRTNFLTYSEQFDTSWVNNGVTIISNDTIAPNGALTAERITGTSGAFNVVKFSSWTESNKVASCFAKANTSSLFKISNASGADREVVFNLQTQSITASAGFIGSIEPLANGWFRCVAIDTLGRTGTIGFGVTAIGESVYMWGAQLEAGLNSTSYIPTLGSAVTRNADLIYKTGISDLLNPSEGTFFVEISALGDYDGLGFVQLSSNSDSNAVSIWYSGLNRISIRINNSTAAYNLDFDVPNYTINTKVLIRWISGDTYVFINGEKLALYLISGSGDAIPAELNRLDFKQWWGGNQFKGKCKGLQVYKTALSDAECIALTTI